MPGLSSAARAIVACTAVTAAACRAGAPLPTATATLGWARVSLPRGGYCWQSGGTGTCADSNDSAGADTLLRSCDLKPFTIAGAGLPLVSTQLQPVSGRGEPDHWTDWRTGSVTHAATFDLSSVPGEYVYVISGTWPEGTVDFYLHVVNGYT